MKRLFFTCLLFLTSTLCAATPPEHFSSRIYNNSTKKEHAYSPTFTILNTKKGFDIPQAITAIKGGKIDTIILVFAGQQNFLYGTSTETDILYGKALTGSDRILLSGQFLWTGSFKVHTTQEYSSVAARLYDKYHERALIIDVLNTKYDWERTEKSKNKVFKNFYGQLRPLFDAISKKDSFNCLVCGFSRGGVMAWRFADKFNDDFGHVKAVVTVDPVINPLSDEESLIKKVAVNKDEWKLVEPESFSRGIKDSFSQVFPVVHLKSDIDYYNVFQRRSLKEGSFIAKPIGSAVMGATSPYAMKWKGIVPATEETPFDQYDTSINQHTPDMLERYGRWIDSVMAKYLK